MSEEKYDAHQGLFDEMFAEIIVKTFVGFDRAKFEQLAENDSVAEEVRININWYSETDDVGDWEEGDISYFSDGMPAMEEE